MMYVILTNIADMHVTRSHGYRAGSSRLLHLSMYKTESQVIDSW